MSGASTDETKQSGPRRLIKSTPTPSPRKPTSLPALCPSSFYACSAVCPRSLHYHAHYTAPKFRFTLSSIDHVPSFRQPLALITLTLLTLPSLSPSHPPSHHHHPRPYRIRSPGLFASIVSCRYLGPSCPFVSPVFSILPAFPSESKFF